MSCKLLLACLIATLAATPLLAEQQPIQVASPHFTLVTDAGEKQARHILDNFERMRWMFQTLFPQANVDPPGPILVFAAKNKKEFEALEPQAYLAKGQLTLAGYFLTTTEKNFVLLRLDAESEHPFATVFHEYTHLQFRDAGTWMPLWLNEGMAEFYQNTDFKDKQVLLGEPSTDDILYLRQNRLIPLETLFRVDQSSPYYHEESKGSVFYSESWALTHYLMVGDREHGTQRIRDYLLHVSQHLDPVTAATQAFGDLKQLEKALGFYIEQSQYKQFILSSAAAPIDPASYSVSTLTLPQYDAERADLLAYIGRASDARSLLANVIAADPKLALPHETMGYLAFRDGDMAAAQKAYSEAVDLDSQSYIAHYNFASFTQSNGNATDPRIETSLRAAIRLNPRFAPAYDQLAGWYARQHIKMDEAQALNLKAITLDRSNLGFRLNASNLLLMLGKFDDAEKTLRVAQALAKSPSDASLLAGRIEQIESIKRANAANAAAQSASETVRLPDGTVTAVVSGSESADPPPRHPVEAADGPKHIVIGTLRDVECASPGYMEFRVEAAGKGKSAHVYTPNRFKIDLEALGFNPPAQMNPCLDFEGAKARVQFATGSDKTIDGLIVMIELRSLAAPPQQ